jgi:hypothetical protein
LLSIFYVKKKEEKQKQKKKMDKGPNKKRRRKRKERYLCNQVSIYFQDLEERSYFQV